MSITTISSRDFARDLAHAKRATNDGPVFVTDRGRPTYALLKIEDYYKLAGAAADERPKSLLDLMDALPGAPLDAEQRFKFDPPRLGDLGLKPADLD